MILRKQDFEEAVATYKIMFETYKHLGYELIEVPKLSVEERASFIIKNVVFSEL